MKTKKKLRDSKAILKNIKAKLLDDQINLNL